MKRNKQKELGAVIVVIAITFLVMIASFILSIIGYEGTQVAVVNDAFDTSLVSVKNIFSVEGIRFIIGNFASNIKVFQPLAILIASLIGASIIESSGFLRHVGTKLKHVKPFTITFVVVIISMISIFFGDYSYLLLLPVVAILYKEIGRSPVLGLLTVFLGITIGYGSGLFVNYHDFVLGGLTQSAARVEIDRNYEFLIDSYRYISWIATFVLALFLSINIEKKLVKRLPKPEACELDYEEENVRKGMLYASFVLIGFLILTVVLITPNSFAAKYMLDLSSDNYTAKLFSADSPFREGIFLFILLAVSIASYVYGTVTKKYKNTKDFSSGFSTYFDDLGIIFVLIFFISQLIAILNWTNIGNVIAVKLTELISLSAFSGLPLILLLFVVTLIIGLFVTSTIAKWEIMSPLTVPVFMRANMTPEFSQFIFKAADGVSKAFTPLFPFYIILLGFIKKYNDKKPISLFGAMRLMLPIIIASAILWFIIIASFYVIGLPIGNSGISTL